MKSLLDTVEPDAWIDETRLKLIKDGWQSVASYKALDSDVSLYSRPKVEAMLIECRNKFEWQPIETAPKDGKYYLLYKNGRINNARWRDGTWGGEGWCYEMAENIANGHTKNMPTHWMPLPEPPVELRRMAEKE